MLFYFALPHTLKVNELPEHNHQILMYAYDSGQSSDIPSNVVYFLYYSIYDTVLKKNVTNDAKGFRTSLGFSGTTGNNESL